jgi:predicted PhzF superfamily epimerase YddE/YHI9
VRAPIFQIDAFTTRRFAGNPAAVMPLEAFPADATLQAIAAVMDFPARPSQRITPPPGLVEALGADPTEVFSNSFNYLALFQSAQVMRGLSPDMAAVARLDRPGVIVTAPGEAHYDFFSRYFAPAKGIPEDPVTGAAHCMLTPYWAHRLGKTSFRAFQCSRRGGEVLCRLRGERVELEGSCVFYLEGEVEI